jgi:hypothetical protein
MTKYKYITIFFFHTLSSNNAKGATHLVHSFIAGPKQFLQDEWQGSQTLELL